MLHTLAPIAARIGDILLERRQTIAVADILLGLPREELAGYESVTEDYARVQAEAIRANFRADWGIAESGAAGPEPHPRGAPAGRTCIAVSGPDLTVSITVDTGLTDRIDNMGAFTQAALTFLRDTLENASAPVADQPT